jgi:hypothetical protein
VTRDELRRQLDALERDLWKVLREHGMARRIPDHAVEEFALYVALDIKPTWET